MVKVRRALHRLPETGWLEFGTAALAAGKMRDLGYTLTMGAAACSKTHRMGVPATDVLENAKRCALEAGADKELVERMEGGLTGFWADLPCGGGPGPLFALRFDMDANDISECRDPAHVPEKLGFASVRQGAMHACGHDAHVAIGLAVAEILAGVKDRLRGSLRIIFQPGEEGSRGSAPMVAAGCTKGVDYILGLHIGCSADKPGMLICGARNFLATTKWDVRFSGRAAHAGMAPNEGKNAILAACTATVNMHAIARHGAGPTRITVGKISGGQGRNIIPPNAALVMETRGATTALNSYMAKEARRILEAAAAMWDCGLAVDTVGEAPSGESSPAMVEVAMSLARTLPEFTDIQGIRDFAGTEDFTAMMSAVQAQGGQGTYLQVGTSLAAGHHNERFDIEEGSMVSAVRIACLMALEYLRQP
jgi:aminobenzoyl-glutamate utilization protein A